MKNFLFLLFNFTSIFLVASCGTDNPDRQAENELRDSVFVIHDEVMPKIADINRLNRELKNISTNAESLDSATNARISNTILLLEKADEGMMEWMREFKQPGSLRSSKSHEEIMAYLRGEMEEIKEVKEDMLSAIEAGQALLDSLKSE